jgi:hypothetical protein
MLKENLNAKAAKAAKAAKERKERKERKAREEGLGKSLASSQVLLGVLGVLVVRFGFFPLRCLRHDLDPFFERLKVSLRPNKLTRVVSASSFSL